MKKGISTSAVSSIAVRAGHFVLLVVGRHYSLDRERYHASGPVEYGTWADPLGGWLSGPGTGRVGGMTVPAPAKPEVGKTDGCILVPVCLGNRDFFQNTSFWNPAAEKSDASLVSTNELVELAAVKEK